MFLLDSLMFISLTIIAYGVKMTIGYVSHDDLGWSNNKNYLMVDNVILRSQTAHPPKSADRKAHFTNWSYGFSLGYKQFVLINCSRNTRYML